MPEGASRTAEVVCFFRAMETHRPQSISILSDPFAELFLSKSWRAFAKSPWARLTLAPDHHVEGHGRGLRPFFWPTLQASMLQGFVAARHREMDDRLAAFLEKPGGQVVVLGAGYDTRALRFAERLAGRKLIEVDFPATQAQKQRILAARLPEAQSRVAAYLGVDFLKDALDVALARPPFVPGERTFFIWEGVTMYLTEAVVGATLATLARLGGAGSELVCDLWSEPTEPGLGALARRHGAGLLARIGEPLLFALPTHAATDFFARHGWAVGEVADGRGLGARWGRPIFPDNSVVFARRGE